MQPILPPACCQLTGLRVNCLLDQGVGTTGKHAQLRDEEGLGRQAHREMMCVELGINAW